LQKFPGQQGWPEFPQAWQVRVPPLFTQVNGEGQKLLRQQGSSTPPQAMQTLALQSVNGAVQCTSFGQQVCPSPPQDPLTVVQAPAVQVAVLPGQVADGAMQDPALVAWLQQPPFPQTPPAQQGSPAPPQVRQVPAPPVGTQARPEATQKLPAPPPPAQQGVPKPPQPPAPRAPQRTLGPGDGVGDGEIVIAEAWQWPPPTPQSVFRATHFCPLQQPPFVQLLFSQQG
jgi:hypothetical protein